MPLEWSAARDRHRASAHVASAAAPPGSLVHSPERSRPIHAIGRAARATASPSRLAPDPEERRLLRKGKRLWVFAVEQAADTGSCPRGLAVWATGMDCGKAAYLGRHAWQHRIGLVQGRPCHRGDHLLDDRDSRYPGTLLQRGTAESVETISQPLPSR